MTLTEYDSWAYTQLFAYNDSIQFEDYLDWYDASGYNHFKDEKITSYFGFDLYGPAILQYFYAEYNQSIVTKPGDFNLSTNAENPAIGGNFDLFWTTSSQADYYSVYSYSSPITEINGSLTLVNYQQTELYFNITNQEPPGDYYYIVIASNQVDEILSNCIMVTVTTH